MALRILLVDPDPATRETLRDMVVGFGHQVACEMARPSDVAELFRCRQCNPDLILIDVDLDFLDGLNAVAQIRKSHPSARLVLVTSSTAPADEIRSMGALGILRKPCNPEMVERVLAQFENAHRQTRVHVLPSAKAR